MNTPLVSILIPAYNAEKWIGSTIRSAMAQTWKSKEIIVVDDGSRDHTLDVARQYESESVRVVASKNQGAAATRNLALEHSRGDYIQYLDADDLLMPDKIERQLATLRGTDSRRILVSSPWAHFYYRTNEARFVNNALCSDLAPVEWLVRKMGGNLHMQTGTWLTSRELIQAAGPWNTTMISDDDGEYFCRVLLASKGTRFVEGTGVLYRITGSSRVSFIGASNQKKDAMLGSMKLHVQYLRSLEESDRVRRVCLAYLQTWYDNFYPERSDIVSELQALAVELGGSLEIPRLRWKYAWMKPVFGWKTAKGMQRTLPQFRASCLRTWDKAMYQLQSRELQGCISAQ